MKLKAKRFENEVDWCKLANHKNFERVAVFFYKHELFNLEDLTDWIRRRLYKE